MSNIFYFSLTSLLVIIMLVSCTAVGYAADSKDGKLQFGEDGVARCVPGECTYSVQL